MKKIVVRLLILTVLVGAAWGGYALYKSIPRDEETIATAKVRKGDVIVRSYSRGELRAVRSATLTAPNLFGTVQVTRMAQLGSFARERDLVIEFDDSEVLSRLEEKQLELDQIDEQIKKAKAELAIRNNQDQVELLRARYSVRRSELEVKRNELVSPIDAQRNLLTLDESNQRLKQLESDIKSRLESAEAELAVLSARRSKAQLELARERTRLNQVKLLSPMSGLVSVRQNLGGGFRMMGATVPDIREGDQVQPGMPVADVLDLSELEVNAKVGELDRANLREGQEVSIQLDAIPEHKFDGRIKSMSATASSNMFSGDPAKKFDVTFSVDMKQLLSSLGAKPEQIARMMATAEQNRRKPPMAAAIPAMTPGGGPVMMMAGGGMPGGGMPGAGMQAGGPMGPGGAEGPAGEGRRGGGGGRFFTMGPGGGQGGPGGGGPGTGMSDEDRQKIRAAMQKALGGRNMQDLTPEERREIFQKLQKENPTLFAGRGPRQGGEGGNRGEGAGRGEGRPGGEGRGRRAEGAIDAGMAMPAGGSGSQQFTLKDIEAAKLPPPPEQDSQLDVLLRPGLLADVEIIVEKIPDAIHVPAQAVIEKEGKMIAYVQNRGRWEAREVKPLKRSESTMVIASGLNPGEIVALSDPTVKRSDKDAEKPQGGAAMPVPGAGGGRGGSR
jgi:multidrug resistance efflux pump